MTNPSVLLELAGRVKALTGGDAMIGAEVEIAVRGFPEKAYRLRNGMRPKGSPTLDRMTWAAEFFGPGPTASIDAAMTLAIGFNGQVTFLRDGTAGAFLWHPYPPYPMAGEANSATLALALTAACLRALAAREG